jgi:hypothetical protein
MDDEDKFDLVDETLFANPTNETQTLVLYESAQIMELRKEIDALKTRMSMIVWTNFVVRGLNLAFNPIEIARGHVKEALFLGLQKLFSL